LRKLLIKGNSKMGKQVLIFNLPPGPPKIGGTCTPSRFCNAECYARKGQHNLPSVIEANKWRLDESKKPTFADSVINELKASTKPYVRIHASGDFYNVKYVNSWIKIAKACPEKKFRFFTKRRKGKIKEAIKELASLDNVVGSESLDPSRPNPEPDFLDRTAMVVPVGFTSNIEKVCPGGCDDCGYYCWNQPPGNLNLPWH